MVCDKCEKKLGRVITPDPWKSGARNTLESGGRKVGENKAISGNKARFNPYTSKFESCRICRQKVHQVGSHYCQACAYKKAICAMCGKKLLDTKNYKQSSAWCDRFFHPPVTCEKCCKNFVNKYKVVATLLPFSLQTSEDHAIVWFTVWSQYWRIQPHTGLLNVSLHLFNGWNFGHFGQKFLFHIIA